MDHPRLVLIRPAACADAPPLPWQHQPVEDSRPRFEFTDLRFDGVNGPTAAEVAIGAEAHLVILDGATVILSEPDFEVLLLAQELDRWLATQERSDFTADLGSVREDPGLVRIVETPDGWIISSDLTQLRSTAQDFESVAEAARTFITDVGRQVAAAGHDPRLSTTL